MRIYVYLLFCLLAGCDFSYYEKQRTVLQGQVQWDNPNVWDLKRAILACSTVKADMAAACRSRDEEAALLLAGIKSCRNSDLPACHRINLFFYSQPFNGLVGLVELYSYEWYFNLPVEDLNTLKPENNLLWAFWGWDDVQAVLHDRVIRHKPLILGILLSLIAAGLAYLLWLIILGRRKDENARLEAIAHAEVERLDAQMRQEEAARLENERLIEEARQLEEAARLKEKQEALLEKQRQLAEEARLAREQAERELAAENERAQKALEIALKDVTTRPKIRPNKRWATVRRESDNQT